MGLSGLRGFETRVLCYFPRETPKIMTRKVLIFWSSAKFLMITEKSFYRCLSCSALSRWWKSSSLLTETSEKKCRSFALINEQNDCFLSSSGHLILAIGKVKSSPSILGYRYIEIAGFTLGNTALSHVKHFTWVFLSHCGVHSVFIQADLFVEGKAP